MPDRVFLANGQLQTSRERFALSTGNTHPLSSSIAREDESQLVGLARAGNHAAFKELVSRYEGKIFRLTWNIAENQEDAEDAMQDAFLNAYAHLEDFRGQSRFYTWLVRIAANEALMQTRPRLRERPRRTKADGTLPLCQ
jgi:DNA-directed RNA polymerase specialized sigma24 family protein